MAKILFLNISSHGHINPTIAIAKTLAENGNDVTYLLPEESKDKVSNIGIEIKLCKNILDIKNIRSNEASETLKKYLNNFEEVFKFIRNSDKKFDLIIYDQILICIELIAKKMNIPTISSITTFVIGEGNYKEVLGVSILELFNLFQKNNEIKEIIYRICKDNEVEISNFINVFLTERTGNIVYTSKYFQPNIENVGDNYKFIGPSIIDRQEKFKLSEIMNVSNNKKKVYISLGTVDNNAIDFYKKCFNAFRDIDMDFILSIGNKIAYEDLGEIPDNFFVHRYVPQLKVLEVSDIFISHGGMNSTSEALYYGVPVLIVPQAVDQPIVANRVKELKAGLIIDKSNVTSELLKSSLYKLINDATFKINSNKIGKSFKEAGGYKEAVNYIEGILDVNRNVISAKT